MRALAHLIHLPSAATVVSTFQEGSLLRSIAGFALDSPLTDQNLAFLEGARPRIAQLLSSAGRQLCAGDLAARQGAAPAIVVALDASQIATGTGTDLTGAFSGRRVTHVARGTRHSLACCDDGSLWAWGDNSQGQLGTGDFEPADEPRLVLECAKVVRVYAGTDFSLALTATGKVFSFGSNTAGQLGYDTKPANFSNRPCTMHLPSEPVVLDCAVGVNHSLLLLESGAVCGVGDNSNGQLGLAQGGIFNMYRYP